MRFARLAAFSSLIFGAATAHAADAPLPGLSLPTADKAGFASGWYLRGDISYSTPADGQLQVLRTVPGTIENYATTRIGKAMILGGGIGYYVMPWLRVDATVEQRLGVKVRGAYSSIGDINVAREDTTADLSATLGLVNLYADLGTWSGITPYLGVGVGAAQMRFGNYAGTYTITPAAPAWGTGVCPAAAPGTNETCASPSTPGRATKTNAAWAVMAGATIDISARLKLDVGYRFLNYGTVAMTPDPAGIAIRLKDMRAHEGRFGLRYLLGGGVL